MFENLNWWEIMVLLLLALFIFGPERLPKVISDALRVARGLRDMARNATRDLSRELGTEVRLEDLNPKTFIRRHLLSEEEEAGLRRPFEDAYRDLKQITADVNDYRPRPSQPELPAGTDGVQRPDAVSHGQASPGHPSSPGYAEPGPHDPGQQGYPSGHRPYDTDAT